MLVALGMIVFGVDVHHPFYYVLGKKLKSVATKLKKEVKKYKTLASAEYIFCCI
jgi:hypothetical protein